MPSKYGCNVSLVFFSLSTDMSSRQEASQQQSQTNSAGIYEYVKNTDGKSPSAPIVGREEKRNFLHPNDAAATPRFPPRGGGGMASETGSVEWMDRHGNVPRPPSREDLKHSPYPAINSQPAGEEQAATEEMRGGGGNPSPAKTMSRSPVPRTSPNPHMLEYGRPHAFGVNADGRPSSR